MLQVAKGVLVGSVLPGMVDQVVLVSELIYMTQ